MQVSGMILPGHENCRAVPRRKHLQQQELANQSQAGNGVQVTGCRENFPIFFQRFFQKISIRLDISNEEFPSILAVSMGWISPPRRNPSLRCKTKSRMQNLGLRQVGGSKVGFEPTRLGMIIIPTKNIRSPQAGRCSTPNTAHQLILIRDKNPALWQICCLG